jgi:hypothetical protein
LDISGAYDNALIDVLCGVMLEKELPLGIVRFMWSLLWCKTLVVCVGGVDCMTLTEYKGLPQGSVLSLLLYNLLGSGMDRVVSSGCDFLQYADGIVVYSVYSSHYVLQTACALVLVTQCIFFAAWTHDILYKVGGGIVLSEALAASGLDPD